ncbi:MAG TPA: cob(I)yrinic acid a,c-diamide adenosyltransferase [Bacteroidales bacterium]|nr:cob(I)yrinic acid a,c-diamide adenosyltransferase [Bacteroidales bacterium]
MTQQKNHIYTKSGDAGQTSLIGGSRVSKSDLRLDAFGTLDELNSFVGLVRDFAIEPDVKKTLFTIQTHIFVTESILATDATKTLDSLPGLSENDIQMLEHEIDRMSQHLPLQQSFIIPGGHPVVSYCHIARTICRRAERAMAKLKLDEPKQLLTLKYINRLSDYFFILARFVAKELGVEENYWDPQK